MTNKDKAKIIFKEELEYITHSGIKNFTLKCFEELTPNYFWEFVSSPTQKYHPKVSNKKHGIVLHTKLCVWWARELADNFNVENLDIIISALLLHDLQKFGKILDQNNKPTLAEYWGTHGPVLAVQIENIYDNNNINEEIANDINVIVICIALHMGRFTNRSLSCSWEKTSMVEKNNKLIEIVQLADFCASRQVDKKIKELDNYVFIEV